MKNLWPTELNVKHTLTPKEFLITQASYLSSSTNGKIVGDVSSMQTSVASHYVVSDDLTGDVFIHSLTVNAPAIKYSLRVLSFAHQALKIFPVNIYSNLGGDKYTANTIEEIETYVGIIFKNPSVIEPLQNLILQSPDSDF